MRNLARFGLAAACSSALGVGAAHAELLPLSCDDSVGATVGLVYLDSSPEFEEQDEFTECGTAPVGTWAAVSHDDDTSAAEVSARAEARSDDGFVLEAVNDLFLDVGGGFIDFASIAVGLVVEGNFTAPDAAGTVDADLVVEVVRSGELEDAVLSLLVTGPGVDVVLDDLEDEPSGELRIPVDLEAGEEYRALLTADAALTDSGEGSQALRFSVDAEPVPEPRAVCLLAVGAFVLLSSASLQRPRRSAHSGAGGR